LKNSDSSAIIELGASFDINVVNYLLNLQQLCYDGRVIWGCYWLRRRWWSS